MFVIQLSHRLPYCFSQLYIVIDRKLRKGEYIFFKEREKHVVIIVYHVTIERDFMKLIHYHSRLRLLATIMPQIITHAHLICIRKFRNTQGNLVFRKVTQSIPYLILAHIEISCPFLHLLTHTASQTYLLDFIHFFFHISKYLSNMNPLCSSYST